MTGGKELGRYPHEKVEDLETVGSETVDSEKADSETVDSETGDLEKITEETISAEDQEEKSQILIGVLKEDHYQAMNTEKEELLEEKSLTLTGVPRKVLCRQWKDKNVEVAISTEALTEAGQRKRSLNWTGVLSADLWRQPKSSLQKRMSQIWIGELLGNHTLKNRWQRRKSLRHKVNSQRALITF